VIGHSPPPAGGAAPSDVARLESLLSDWFERNVVLLSSGRTGLRLLLAAKGLSRYRDAVRVPAYLSRCVINAVTHNAMPALSGEASATLLYHQYGFEQRHVPHSGVVIEDLAHAFFAAPDSGARRWRSDAAIFSLPKFFGTAGLGGGVIVERADLAAEIRERAAAATRPAEDVRGWMRSVVAGVRDCPPGEPCPQEDWLDAVYELLYAFAGPDAADLAGMPETRSGLAAVGAERAARVAELRLALPRAGWEAMGDTPVPYALPLFGDREALNRIDAALAAEGIHAGVYHLDVRRDMSGPDYRAAVLLPCHQGMSSDHVESVRAAVAAVSNAVL
jgi:hypothetical protein